MYLERVRITSYRKGVVQEYLIKLEYDMSENKANKNKSSSIDIMIFAIYVDNCK